MKLRLVTVAFDPESGTFPEDPLREVEGEIVNVVEHFFHHGGRPHLLLLVHLEPLPGERRPQGGDDRIQLAPHERPLFERLRAWRNGRAQADGVPVYTLLTNKQLVELVRRRPNTLDALADIPGIGASRRDRFGTELLAVLAAEPAP